MMVSDSDSKDNDGNNGGNKEINGDYSNGSDQDDNGGEGGT